MDWIAWLLGFILGGSLGAILTLVVSRRRESEYRKSHQRLRDEIARLNRRRGL